MTNVARARRIACLFLAAGSLLIGHGQARAQETRIPVSCARGEDLQRYIDSAPAGFEVYIEDGPCTGNFTLRHGVRVVGAPGAGVELIAAPASRTTVLVPEGTVAVLEAVTIRGDVHVAAGASLNLRSITVTGRGSVIRVFDARLFAIDLAVIDAGGVDLVGGTGSFVRSLFRGNFARVGPAVRASGAVVVLEETQVVENDADQNGGGIAVYHSDVRIHRSLIARNQTRALYNINGHGGGLYVQASTVQVTSSSIVENSANFGHGGGIYVADALTGFPFSVVRLENTTIYNNAAGFWRRYTPGLWGLGGGIYVAAGHDVEMRYVTLAHNWAHEGGGLWVGGARATRARASIVSGNVGGVVAGECGGSGGLTGNYLLVYDPVGCRLPAAGTVGNITGVSPRLGAPASDGATTFLPLGAKSPALDRIPVKACLMAADQRLRPRPQGSGCDLGAVEGK